MKKALFAALMLAFSFPAFTQEGPAALQGKMLVASDGARVGAVYRVTGEGAAQVIVDGKMITIPANTLSIADGKLTTSLSKSEIRKLR